MTKTKTEFGFHSSRKSGVGEEMPGRANSWQQVLCEWGEPEENRPAVDKICDYLNGQLAPVALVVM